MDKCAKLGRLYENRVCTRRCVEDGYEFTGGRCRKRGGVVQAPLRTSEPEPKEEEAVVV